MLEFLSEKISSLFSSFTGKNNIPQKAFDDACQQLRDALLEADVPYAVVEAFVEEMRQQALQKKVFASLNPSELLMKVVYDTLVSFLGGAQAVVGNFPQTLPATLMVMGLQGSGKTTTLAKLVAYSAHQAKKQGKKRHILVASVDFQRPAAIDQLEILAQRCGVDFYRAQASNAVSAAAEIMAYAKRERYEVVGLDTAGRLHVDTSLLDELAAIEAVVKPTYKIMVLDAMTGQESLRVAQAFADKVGFSGAIVTKADSQARGGVLFAFRYMFKKPIYFVGVGEKIEDLDLFYPERAAQRILGMGDIMSLVEKAQDKIKQAEHEKSLASFSSGALTLQDFAQHIEMINQLGSLSSVIKYLPGAAGKSVSSQDLEHGELELKKFKAIISSMTLKERLYPKILNASRKQRIAKGSGVTVADVTALLIRFEESQQFVKLFKKMGKFNSFFKQK